MIAFAFIATFIVAFILGGAFGVRLDTTQRNKPIEIGIGKVLVARTTDPTEFCLVDPFKRYRKGTLGIPQKLSPNGEPLEASEVGVLLARIRIASPSGAWVLRNAFESAVEAAKKKLVESDFDQDGGAA